MNDFLSNILSSIGANVNGVQNYFKSPSNPYGMQSPVPNSELVTRNLPPGFSSPVPQGGILQHIQGGSGFQNDINNLQKTNHVNEWANTFFGSQPAAAPFQKPLTQQMPVQQQSIPNVQQQPIQQTASQPNVLGDFTTSPIPQDYNQMISASASKYGVNPNLLASLLFSEHGFSRTPGYNYNTNGSYDRGPAQINSAAHPEVTDAQALDPQFAIDFAAKTLAGHIKNLGIKRGILAYNMGANGSLGIDDPTKTLYYQKVVSGLSPYLRKRLGL